MTTGKLPYRECLHCETISDCRNIDIEQDGFGTLKLPDDCPKKKEYEKADSGKEIH